MRKIIWIAHISLDGYVANSDGQLDDFESGEDNLDFVADICREADTILSGRITHTLLHSFWPEAGRKPGATQAEKKYSQWYNSATKVVASRSLLQPEPGDILFVHDQLPQFVQQVKQQQGKSIVIFGSPNVAGQLMDQNLIDIYWIFINPVIFGRGVPLFTGTACKRKLKLTETRRFANGETVLKYVADNQAKIF